MGLIDSLVSNAFRDEKAGRVVVFSGDRRNRGYLIRSISDEQKIRSFLKMFYFAHLSIFWLGMLLAYALSTFVIHLDSLGNPARHLLRTELIYLGVYSVVVALPYLFLWKSYKRSFLAFVSPEDEVLASRKTPVRPVLFAGLAISALGVFAAISYLIRAR